MSNIRHYSLIGKPLDSIISGEGIKSSEVIYTMPQEAYENIYLKLGDECSNKQIVNEYMSNKKYYDSLAF